MIPWLTTISRPDGNLRGALSGELRKTEVVGGILGRPCSSEGGRTFQTLCCAVLHRFQVGCASPLDIMCYIGANL